MSNHAVQVKASLARSTRRGAAPAIMVICIFAALQMLATNIFLPSLPKMAADLRVSSAAATSAITVFLVVSALVQLIVGPLSDRFGRATPLLAGFCIAFAGTIWCTSATDLSNLLAGRIVQACGTGAAGVLARAIARDLFDGQPLARVMSFIMIATAAAPGFSPLLGGTLDHFFGWRSEFLFVAIYVIFAASAFVTLVGETHHTERRSINPLTIARSYLALGKDARFYAPGITSSMVMAGMFGILSAFPRLLVERFGFSPIALGVIFACVVFVVIAAGVVAPTLSGHISNYRAALIGVVLMVIGGVALLAAVTLLPNSLLSIVSTAIVFLIGAGLASPLSSAAALSPFGDRAGIAAGMLGFAQATGAALGVLLAAVLSADPGLALGYALCLTSALALALHRLRKRTDGHEPANATAS